MLGAFLLFVGGSGAVEYTAGRGSVSLGGAVALAAVPTLSGAAGLGAYGASLGLPDIAGAVTSQSASPVTATLPAMAGAVAAAGLSTPTVGLASPVTAVTLSAIAHSAAVAYASGTVSVSFAANSLVVPTGTPS